MTFQGIEELNVSGKVHFVRVRGTYCSSTLILLTADMSRIDPN